MIKFCGIQNNVNRLIKDVLKNLRTCIEEGTKKRQQSDNVFECPACTIGAAGENCEELNKRRERRNAILLR